MKSEKNKSRAFFPETWMAAGHWNFCPQIIATMKKILGLGIAGFFTVLLVFVWRNYHPDIPTEVLEERYAYPEDSGFLPLQGMLVHYRSTGQGFPVILLHGTGASLHTWESWTQILSQRFRVISVDLPAFGLTGARPDGDYSLESYVGFVDAFCTALGLDSFSLAGNSLGGLIAWNYAATHRGKVKKLILLDAAGFPGEGKPPMAIRLARNPWTARMLTKITPKNLVRKSLLEVYADDSQVTSRLINRYFELLLRPGSRQAYIDRAKFNLSADTRRLSGLEMPVLIQWGKKDTWIPVADANRFRALLPQSELIIYPDSGHLPMEENPIESGRDALQFLLNP